MNTLPRRRFLQVGALSTLGLSLPQLLEAEARAANPKKRIKSCIFIFLSGGPSQLDTFDMKPDAPVEIRGEFKPIQTSVAGTHIVEHLPKTAQLAQHYSIVRTLYHNKRNHQPASSFVLTGVDPLVDNAGALAPKPDDPPALGSLVVRAVPPDGGVPPFVMMPARMNDQGSVHRGQAGGWLGSPFDPMLITQDPNASTFKVQGMAPDDGMPPDRMTGRQQLLTALDRKVGDLEAASRAMSVMQQRAFDMLSSGKGQAAFKLSEEKASVRDRYGRNMFGQGLLLARRLIEAGSRLVTVSDCASGGGHEWDTHGQNFKKLKGTLLPRFDQSFSALMQDLLDRGMLNDTVVYVAGEFGRTPKIGYANATFASPDGRDHYPGCFFSLLAGGRTTPGMVYGQSDSKAGSPARDPMTPEDMTATLFAAMGLDPEMHILSRDNRPMALTHGRPAAALLG